MMPRIHVHDLQSSELVLIGAPELDLIPAEIDRLIRYLEGTPSPVLRDIAYTCGMEANSPDNFTKVAIVATSPQDLREKLDLALRRIESGKRSAVFSKGVYIGTDKVPAPGRTVFLFPGEGSQYPDMLRSLTMHFPACRSSFDDADTACAMAGAPYLPSQWIFPTGELPKNGITETLGLASAIQAVIAADNGILRLFTMLGITPDAVAGAGIGEIVAMECAKAIAYESRKDRLNALQEGYSLLSEIRSKGKKLLHAYRNVSVDGLQRAKLTPVLAPYGDKVLITRDQAQDLFTLCIDEKVAPEVLAKLSEAGGVTRAIPIKLPFHTPWVRPILSPLKDLFHKIVKVTPDFPVYSFMTASPHTGAPSDWAEQMAEQWAHPMRLRDTIERLYADGFRVFVELGPRGALSTSVSAILRHKPHLALAANRGHRDDLLQLHHTLACLAAHGMPIDIAKLHAYRDSQLVDILHPGPTQIQRQARSVALPTGLPSLSEATIPAGLIAAPPASHLSPLTAEASPHIDTDDGRTDFPLLASAEIIKFSPEEHIDLVSSLSVFDYPFLLDRTISGRTSVSDHSLRGLLFAPVEILLEIMVEAARKVFPQFIPIAVENLTLVDWPVIRDGKRGLRIRAKRLPQLKEGANLVQVAIYDGASFSEETPVKLAETVVHLSDEYRQPPMAATLALRTPEHVDWESSDLYSVRIYMGQSFHSILQIPDWGENGLHADCVVLPRGSTVRDMVAPRFSIDPVLLSAVGSSLAIWHAREPANGHLHIPYGCDRIDFYSPTLTEWTRCELSLFTTPTQADARVATADAEMTDQEQRLLIKVSGWHNRVVRILPQLHELMLHPTDGFFTEAIAREELPSLPHEVVCCAAPALDSTPDDPDYDILMQITASLTLSAPEQMKFDELDVSDAREIEWLFGKIAAKDAVRRCLLARYGRKWAAADIRIESDEAGKPAPQGDWRRLCGAQMDISITHTVDRIVAAAAPNTCLGIDIENRNRILSEEFVTAAFSNTEQEIAAETGDGATALVRFWCAKEALSKALGTGLRFGTGDLTAHSIDTATGRIEMEATHLWLQVFPSLRGKRIDVQSCLLNDIILAVCVLDTSLLETSQGPFPHWA